MVGNRFIVYLSALRDGRVSARVPGAMLRELAVFAKSEKWSVADALIYLVYAGLDVVRHSQLEKGDNR